MTGLWIVVILYYGFGLFLFIGIKTGALELNIRSAKTGEEVEMNSFIYNFIVFTYCFGWLYPAIKCIRKGLKK